jgi:phosphoribosyl 1,2-cyclic phosphodiesterase
VRLLTFFFHYVSSSDGANQVHHGRLWAPTTPPAFTPTPATSLPSTPAPPSTPKVDSSPSPEPPTALIPNHGQGVPELHPYFCHGFKIQDSVVYISDASWIPEESWAVLNEPFNKNPSHQYDVAIVDCLRPKSHISHYGIKEAVNVARRINAQRTYLTGFGHEVSHDEYVTVGEYVGGKVIDNPTVKEKYCIDLLDEGKNIWLRPSHDGLRIEATDEGVRDNSYE